MKQRRPFVRSFFLIHHGHTTPHHTLTKQHKNVPPNIQLQPPYFMLQIGGLT
jgi:hypothetical protein